MKNSISNTTASVASARLTALNMLVLVMGLGLYFFRQQLHLDKLVGLSITELSGLIQIILSLCRFRQTKQKTFLLQALQICVFNAIMLAIAMMPDKHIP